MSDAPFIKFFPSDFLGGTSGLSPAERGVYITLLCLIYEADGAIPRDDSRLARRCGAPKATFARILEELIAQSKITEVDGMLSNDRAEKSLIDRRNRTQNAHHAAASRWNAQEQKDKQNQARKDASASSAQCVADAKPEARSQKEKEAIASSVEDFAVEAYNQAAEQCGWAKVQRMSKARFSALRARLAEAGGLEGWQAAIAKASQSDFLCGRRPGRDGPFFASFDFLTQASSFTRLMEGTYDNRSQQRGEPANRPQNRSDAALEQIARLAGLGAAPGYGRA